jgi:2-phospho-L-lactate guanylyltransferase
MIAALIPMKDPSFSKQRLSELLSPEERCHLALAMFRDVLGAVKGAHKIGRVIILGSGEPVGDITRSYGCEFLPDPDARGETEAVAWATHVLSGSIDGLLVIPADVPLIRPEDVDTLVTESRAVPGVTLCPSRDRLGTNGVLRRPADVMPLSFGSNSFYPHRDIAQRLGITCTVVDLPRLGLDIDRPEDLATYLNEAGPSETYRYVHSIGVNTRLVRFYPHIPSFLLRVPNVLV